MKLSRWLFVWRTVVVSLSLLVAGAVSVGARAQEMAPATWEQLGALGPMYRVFAPTSGALLAAGDGKVVRSDDAGASWHDIPLPPHADLSFGLPGSFTPKHLGQGRLAVDPTNHDVMYVSAGVLKKSMDGGATWTALPVEGTVVAVAVSPANPDYVHAVVQTEARE
jgi:photosystem II stability/assembly factor-like uncharacterized protein